MSACLLLGHLNDACSSLSSLPLISGPKLLDTETLCSQPTNRSYYSGPSLRPSYYVRTDELLASLHVAHPSGLISRWSLSSPQETPPPVSMSSLSGVEIFPGRLWQFLGATTTDGRRSELLMIWHFCQHYWKPCLSMRPASFVLRQNVQTLTFARVLAPRFAANPCAHVSLNIAYWPLL